jgi:ribose 5-phosphate isomerase B
MKIGITSDHRGYKTKQKTLKFLKSKGYDVIDYSPDFNPEDDYTDRGFIIGEQLRDKEVDLAIAFCGSGVGISIACNKVNGVRCGKVDSVQEVKSARQEDDINMISLNSNKPLYIIKSMILTFLNTEFNPLDRYVRRVNELKEYEDSGKIS